MIYTLEEQETLDIDWFFLDKNKKLCHVASGGGWLPPFIAISKEDSIFLSTYFRRLPILSNKVIINPNMGKYISWNDQTEKENYLSDFTYFAKIGLYSFDKSKPSVFNDNNYHLVTQPVQQLTLESLPKDIADKLSNNIMNLDIDYQDSFNLIPS